MPASFLRSLLPGFVTLLLIAPVSAQSPEDSLAARRAASAPLFAAADPLELPLPGDLRAVFEDIDDDREDREATLTYLNAEGDTVSLDIGLRTRGFFRRLRLDCSVPPLRLNFKKRETIGTRFEGQDKIKLVTHCKRGKGFEQRLLLEYLVYKAYNLFTPFSFRVRLAEITYEDVRSRRKPLTAYAFFIEEEEQMAARNYGVPLEEQRIHPEATDRHIITLMSIFQYAIGNTDWGVAARHNIKIIYSKNPAFLYPIPVPYDFDWAGLLDAPYAFPDQKLGLDSVRDRLFMGYCRSEDEFGSLFTYFNDQQEAMLALFRDAPMLERKYADDAVRYLEDFYLTISNDRNVRREFIRACRN